MAEIDYSNILNDPETSDNEYSENDDLESEGEPVILRSEHDEGPIRKRPRINNDIKQDNSVAEEKSMQGIRQFRRRKSHVKLVAKKRLRGRNRNIKNESENSDVVSEGENETMDRPRSYWSERSIGDRGVNSIKWCLKELTSSTKSESVSSVHFPSVIGEARFADTPLAAWSCLISDEIIDKIVLHTNEEITRIVQELENRETYHKEIDDIELRAVIGLFYIAGSRKQNKVDVEDLWGEEFAPNIFRTTMPAQRFKFLIRCLRFDDKLTRAGRRKYDRFAPLRDIWMKFIANCTASYSPYEVCTIDEQTITFKGKCIFRTSANTRDRYGLKFIMMNDVKTNYMVNAMPYLGKITDNVYNEPVENYVVRKLVESIRETGRTVIIHNLYVSVNLLQILDTIYGLRVLGTIRKLKKENAEADTKNLSVIINSATTTPTESTNTETEAEITIRDLITEEITSAVTKTEATNTGNLLKAEPELISQYVDIKSGARAFDQACRMYSVARRTRHWPLKLFFDMLDKANVNSTILYNLLNLDQKETRRSFQKDLSFALIKPQLQRRYECSHLRTAIKSSLAALLNIAEPPVHYENVIELDKRVRCHFCHYSLDVKTKTQCSGCKKPMCHRHRCPLCVVCAHSGS